jgi:hypothetical protein
MNLSKMAPIPPNTMLTVVLEAQDWNTVFAALNELPMKYARPVCDRIMGQLQQHERGNDPGDGEQIVPYRREA